MTTITAKLWGVGALVFLLAGPTLVARGELEMGPEGPSHRSGTRRSRRYGDLPRGIPASRGMFASLRSRVARIGRAGAGLLLVLGLASTLEPFVQAVTSAAAGAQPNLILNGSFEQPRQTSDAALSSGSGGLADWTIGGDSVNLDGSGYWQAEDGLQSLDLSGNAPGSVSQTVTGTTAGATYTLSWFVAGNPECGQAVKRMNVYWNGTLVDEPSFNTTGRTHVSMGWVEEQVNVVATGNDTVEFADAASDQSSCGANLDNVSLVPASMGTVRRRRRSTTTLRPTLLSRTVGRPGHRLSPPRR